MKKLLVVVSVLLIAVACCNRPEPAQAVEWINCDDRWVRALDPTTDGQGPLELAKVFCQRIEYNSQEMAMVSPDGSAVMYLQGGTHYAAERKVLHVARLDAHDGWSSHTLAMGPLWQFGQALGSIPAYGWSSDSAGIWTATREKIGENGIAGTGLQPMFISLADRSIRLFEVPRHEAGPLDGLLWADGDGLALAYFGARGASYQPQRHDKRPTFAIIDAKRGVVLDTMPFNVVAGLKDAYDIANVHNAAATRLPSGKLRAVVSALDKWVVWTQGESPRTLPNPYSDPQERHNKMIISRDGSRLLIVRNPCDPIVRAESDGSLRRVPYSWTCKPAEREIAALYDLATGRQLWALRAAPSSYPQHFPNPAISEDGRHALVGLPDDASDPHARVALVSMSDGTIVQRTRLPWPGPLNAIGFLQKDRGVWLRDTYGETALYDFHGRAQ
ncbi:MULTISPECIES: hypothetical protein [unclassified Bradyrhizobium]|uniref:hypothetical protein n=1 Tax=unclassified Bradyrhizobium TaxID=2631580 RepID=UPI0028EAB594|nr:MULTISPECIES: hypothetical protein [unclassified Bradyrhizobium]